MLLVQFRDLVKGLHIWQCGKLGGAPFNDGFVRVSIRMECHMVPSQSKKLRQFQNSRPCWIAGYWCNFADGPERHDQYRRPTG